MSSPNIINVEKFEVLPSNQPSNNTYSFRGGNPIITLTVPSQAKFLRPSSVRLNGTLTVKSSAGVLPNSQNLNFTGPGLNVIQLNPRVGVHSILQNVVLSSEATNQSLESIRQYGRLVTSILSSTHSSDDYMNEKSVVCLANGVQISSNNLVANTVSFSIPLYCGLLQGGNPIPLGLNGLNGLTINLELASDQQVLSGANANDQNGAFYEVQDVSLSGDLLVPDDKGVQSLSVPGSGAFQYNSYSSLYSVINSSDATQTYNLSNSNVLSIIHNFLPVNHSNSYTNDGFTNPELTNTDASGTTYNSPVTLKKVSFSRGGVKLGLDYELDVELDSSEKRPETQLNVQYLNAFKSIQMNTRMLNQNRLLGYGGEDVLPYSSSGDAGVVPSQPKFFGSSVDQQRNFGIGLALDRVSDVGVNFKGQSYSTRIQSTLDGKSPQSVFTFVKAKNVLQYSPNGIVVQN